VAGGEPSEQVKQNTIIISHQYVNGNHFYIATLPVFLSCRYLLYNKPTKVLSPEYLWSNYDQQPVDIKVIRISQLVKNYAEVRPNGGHWCLTDYI